MLLFLILYKLNMFVDAGAAQYHKSSNFTQDEEANYIVYLWSLLLVFL